MTELMKRYEAETGRKPKDLFMGSEESLIHFTREYVEWLEAKASAYDRLMSGGQKTPESPYQIPYGQHYCPVCYGEINTGFRCMKCRRQFSPPMEQEVLDGRM